MTKPQFAPVPMSLVADKRCKEVHLRAAIAIAHRDRFDANGQGCWSGPNDLAALARVNMSCLVTAISELVEWGHVDRQPMPSDRRKRVYRLVYNKAENVCPAANENDDRLPVHEPKNRLPEPKNRLPGDSVTHCNDEVDSPLREPFFKDIPLEAAPRPGRSAASKWSWQDGEVANSNQCAAFVREAETHLRSCRSPDEAERLAGILDDIGDAYDAQSGDSLGGKARRLRDEYEIVADNLRHGNGSDAHERNRLIDESQPEVRRARRKPPHSATAFGPWIGEEIQPLNVDYRAVAEPVGMTDSQIENLAAGRSCVGCETRKKIVAVLDALDARQIVEV